MIGPRSQRRRNVWTKPERWAENHVLRLHGDGGHVTFGMATMRTWLYRRSRHVECTMPDRASVFSTECRLMSTMTMV